MSVEASTLLVDHSGALAGVKAPVFTVQVIQGPNEKKETESIDGRLTVGTSDGVDLQLTDPTVSRFHAEFEATEKGLALRDLGSTNGTRVAGITVREVVLNKDAEIRFGQTKVRLRLGGRHSMVPTSSQTQFGRLIGSSAAMRRVYKLLERAAPTTASVLLTGESGTGKELAARAVHDASERSDGPFEIIDCGGLPPTLIESELFGHDKGAFTNATSDHAGAFERAHGGTVFLDELGELPLDLQPKLLRALGENEIRRIGAREVKSIDVRVVAATNRDLRRQVNSGAFRSDLYYRLAVIQVHLPPLRERLDDLSILVHSLLERIVEERPVEVHIEPDQALLDALAKHHWPGNVRELRNYLEHLVILRVPPDLPDRQVAVAGGGQGYDDLRDLPLRSAKQQVLERFERSYLGKLLDDTAGNVAEAARRAGVDRGTLFRTIRRYGIKVDR